MKRLLAYLFIVLGLGLTFNVNSLESNLIKVDRLKININDQNFEKFNSITGDIEGYKYNNNFYAHVENNELVGLIETFTFSIEYESRIFNWAQNLISQNNSGRSCDQSNQNLYFNKIDYGISLMTCLNVRIINNKNLSSPNFNFSQFIPMHRRDRLIKKFINKNKIIVPNEMLRADHYFYKGGKLVWVFYTSNVDFNSKEKIDLFINDTIKNHSKYEQQLGHKKRNRIVFKNINANTMDEKKITKILESKKQKIKITKETKPENSNQKILKKTKLAKKLSVQIMTEEELIYNKCIYFRQNIPTHIAKKNRAYKWDEQSTCKTYTKIPSEFNKTILVDANKSKKQKIKITNESKPKKSNKKIEKNLSAKEDLEAPILIVNENIVMNKSDYSFIVKATDKGSKKIFIEIDGVISELINGEYKVKRFSPVDEKISIVAIDQWGNRSDPKLVNIKIDLSSNTIVKKIDKLNPTNISSKMSNNKVALIIGIEKYKQSPKATFANLDAKYFYEYAVNAFGLKKENIKLMVDSDATLIQSISALSKWLPSRIVENETDLIIFFAGHGLASNDGKDLFLLSQDSDPDLLARTALSRTSLFKEILKLKPKSVTMFLDTCYSGVSRDEKTLLASARPVRIVADEQDTPNNFTIFSASQLDQISSGFKEAKQGIFSYYLMKGLEGKADANKDKDITNGELLAYMDQNVSQKASELGRQQNPSLAGDPDKILMSYR